MTLITENEMYDNWQIIADCLNWLCGKKSYKRLPYFKMLQPREPKSEKRTRGGKHSLVHVYNDDSNNIYIARYPGD